MDATKTCRRPYFRCDLVRTNLSSGKPITGTRRGDFYGLYTIDSIGLERTNVTRTPTGWTITSNSQLSSPLDISSHVFEMRYSADWHPLELKIDATVKGRPYELHTTFEENIATNKIQESGQTKTHTNPISAETLVLPVNFLLRTKLWLSACQVLR